MSKHSHGYSDQYGYFIPLLHTVSIDYRTVWLLCDRARLPACLENAYLAEEQVELLPRAVVPSLGQEELHLLLDLFLIQMPAVFIVHTGPCCWVRGP